MTKLDDFSKIIVGGNEIGKVLHQGKTIWQKEPDVYLAQDSDFVNVEGYWIYKGTELEVKIPTHINGELVTSTSHMFSKYLKATPVTKVVLKHSNVTDMRFMFRDSSAKTLDLSSFNTSNVTNMNWMFYGSKATTLDLSSFDTSNVTNMESMFYSSNATTLDLSSFDTSNVTNTESMFSFSKATTGYARTQADANKFNSSKGKPSGLNFVVKPSSDVYLAQDSDFVKVDGYWVYRGTELEVEIPTHINGKLVTSTSGMFSGHLEATPVTKVVLIHSNITDMKSMFDSSKATTLDLSSFNTSNVTDMSNMFYKSKATTLDLSSFNTSNVTTMRDMFSLSNATILDLSNFNTSNVTDMVGMFYSSKATLFDLSNFDTSKVTNMTYMFSFSKATTGYARTQADADKFNSSSNKPAGLKFVVKP